MRRLCRRSWPVAVATLVLAGGLAGCGSAGESARSGAGSGSGGRAPVPVLGWSGPGIRRVCTEVSGTFEGQPVDPATVPQLAGLDDEVEFRGLTPVAAGSRCDATLRLEFAGTALSDLYGSAGQRLYVGYDLTGQATLAATGQPTLSYPLDGHLDPPEHAVVGDPPPVDPLDALEEVDFYGKISDALDQFLGPWQPSTTTTRRTSSG